MDESQKEMLREKYMEYIKEDVLPRAQARLLDKLKEDNPEMAGAALEYMRTYEWSKRTRLVYQWYFDSRMEMLRKQTERMLDAAEKKITVLAATSTVISIVCLIAIIYMLL